MIVETLWDLLKAAAGRGREKPRERSAAADRRAKASIKRPVVVKERPALKYTRPAQGDRRAGAMAERYEQVTREMLERYNVRVRRWRSSMSGVAWEVVYRDGTRAKLIESPQPRGPMSAAVFLHEIGHHAIGLGVYRPRCLEEYHAWAFSLRAMEEHGLNVTESVRRRMHQSLHYAVAKARRRGIRELPEELRAFTRPWLARGQARDADTGGTEG